MENNSKPKWPKKVPHLTEEEKCIMDDHMKRWHEISQKKFQLFENFNHCFPVENCAQGGRVLEIGAGIGGHITHENLENTDYYAMEIRPDMAEVIKNKFPKVKLIIGDCQKPMDFPDNHFDKIIAIQLLEHLPDLPATLKEVHRILKQDGEFCVVIPCEGGMAHAIGRYFTARRMFEKRYGRDYYKFIKAEHINTPKEVIEELEKYFTTKKKCFSPLKIPSIHLNLNIGMVLKPK